MKSFTVLPRIVPFTFEDGPAQTGQYVSITCQVPEGDLPLSIQWTFNGRRINKNSQNVIIASIGRKSSVVTIDPVEAANAGNYTCHAKNHAGLVNYTAELFVNGYFFLQTFLYAYE